MLLVIEGRCKINQLGYNKKTFEYVYFHRGKEIWREKGDEDLLNYFNPLCESNSSINEEEIAKFPIYKKYEESCNEFERKER